MLKARGMIEKGATAYRAAKDCNLTVTGITRSTWYRKFIADREAANAGQPGEPSAMDRARKLVEVDGKTAYEAAKLTGVEQSSISRAAWYHDHVSALVDEFKSGGKYAKNN